MRIITECQFGGGGRVYVRVSPDLFLAGSEGNALFMHGATLGIDFGGEVDRLTLFYRTVSGLHNITINGEFRHVDQLHDINGAMIGGTKVSIVKLPDPAITEGQLFIEGLVREFSIGGQELWIDQVCYEPRGD